MTKKIRHNVFETNSSSTHSICVAKDMNVEFPASIHFESGEFGWEHDTLTSIYEKASYLFTAFMHTNHKDEWENVVNKLRSKNIAVTYQDFGGYIDHGYDLSEFVNDMEYEEEKLFSFLFSPLSFIITGNDNSDNDVDIKVPYEYYEYYKGN